MKIKCIHLDVYKSLPPKVIEIEQDDIKRMRELIGCETLDFATRTVGGKTFRFAADDVGFYRVNPRISAVPFNPSFWPLVGNLLVFGVEDKDGELTSLSYADVRLIFQYTTCAGGYYLILGCD